MPKRIPLAYTFGNHMHWVDMQWLWGYDVLPGSTEDMLKYCRELGVKGNLNFDGVAYEKMASDSPEHLALLREAVHEGTVEVVGGSYGQPYGLFHNGESNVRQRIYGVRAAMRVLGNRPRTYWEEEFNFFPQLPQMLAGTGFTGASLYFQWTWHTPEIPMEDVPVVTWEGVDGTQLPTATRNRMNLHQWPEDFRILLDDLAANPPSDIDDIPPMVLQWLELMPTQDWMCRSELMAPMLIELKQDPRFEIIATTLGEYLERWKGKDLPVRKYTLDDVWHGLTLGKNGDGHPKTSARLEQGILEAETAAAILGLFGRPYEPWDVYPTWEFEEMWRMLLAAQHHDNHECEGLCGHVARANFSFIERLLTESNAIERLAKRIGIIRGEELLFNRLGWPVPFNGLPVPSVGYRTGPETGRTPRVWSVEEGIATFSDGGMVVRIDVQSATILELTTENGSITNFPLSFAYRVNGEERIANTIDERWEYQINGSSLDIILGPESVACLRIYPCPEGGDLEIGISVEGIFQGGYIDPGYSGAIRLQMPSIDPNLTVKADSPYAVQVVGKGSCGKRKYPEGDWMTSPQWFESIEGGFTSQSLVNFVRPDGSGLLVTHSGSQQWFRTEKGFDSVMLSIDPWDGNNRSRSAFTTYHLHPHGGITNSACIQRAALVSKGYGLNNVSAMWDPIIRVDRELAPLPKNFSAVTVHSPNVLATAFYREQSSFCKRDLPTYAGEGVSHPYVLRLVEYDGIGGDVEITIAGPLAKVCKTNLLGEVIEELAVLPDDDRILTPEVDKLAAFGIEAARVKVPIRPYEIATLYLDIVPGRKQFRDLDAKREIWATIHRLED